MFIERPPLIYRLLIPKAVWLMEVTDKKSVYLTFDDGPVPEVTPWVLDILDKYNIKATFFVVGDNVRKYPELFEEIKEKGHSFGNHTMHHLHGIKATLTDYIDDIAQADKLIGSTLFRPPHGFLKKKQLSKVCEKYRVIMHDVVSRDYNCKLSSQQVFSNIRRFVRNGSIIVFHDSLKAEKNVKGALEHSIKWLKDNGYEFLPIPM